jgi:hypothetical protein
VLRASIHYYRHSGKPDLNFGNEESASGETAPADSSA